MPVDFQGTRKAPPDLQRALYLSNNLLSIFSSSLVLTVLDKVFDSLEASQYINGDFYTHVNEEGQNCTPGINNDTWKITTSYGEKKNCKFLDETEKTYQCFEKDPVYGYMTIFFLFYPGIMSFQFNLMKMMFTKKFNVKLLLIHLFLVPVFPAVLILQGLISLFHPGKINQITGDWGFSGSS